MLIVLRQKKEFIFFENIVFKWMNFVFDLVVIVLVFFMMVYVFYVIYDLVEIMFQGFDIEEIFYEFLFVIIFLELFEFLIFYIKEYYVSMCCVVEFGVVVLVRKFVIIIDYKVLGWELLIGMVVFIFVLGWIYVQERWRIFEEEKFIIECGLNM